MRAETETSKKDPISSYMGGVSSALNSTSNRKRTSDSFNLASSK